METGSPISRSSDLEGDPSGGLSLTSKEDPEASDAAAPDPDKAGLASVAEEIRHSSRPASDRTGLVLYDVDPDHLQVQWKVALDDLARAGRAFPPTGSPAHVRVLLQRIDPGGETRTVASIDRKADGSGLQDQVVLGVEAGDADYQAELGLASSEGGWLLLARSNQVRPPRPVVERPLPHDGMPGVDDSRVEPALAAVGVPLEPVFPMPGLDRPDSALADSIRSNRVPTDAASGTAVGDKRVAGLEAVSGEQSGGTVGAWAALPPPLLPSTPVERMGDSLAAADLYDPRAALSSRELWPVAPGHRDLELHAELVIWGRATPGDLIDILGTPLRAEPDGSFSLRLPVEDYESLARALSVGVESPTGHDAE